MAFSELKNYLKECGEPDEEIIRVYEVRIGCVAFSGFKVPEYDSERPISDLEELLDSVPKISAKKDDLPETILAELSDALESHSNVFAFKKSELRLPITSTLGNYRIVQGKPVHFRINLPARLHRYRPIFGAEKQKIEQIGVVSNGSFFACYAELMTFPQETWFAQEYRDLLKDVLEKRGKIHSIGVPPCPIHPSIYVAILPANAEPKRKSHALGKKPPFMGDGLLFLLPESEEIETAIEAILVTFSPPLDRFFNLQLRARSVGLYEAEILNEFSNLTDCYKKLLKTGAWHVFKRHTLWVAARTSLSNIHLRLVEYGNVLSEYEREVSDFPQMKESFPHIQPWLKYFAERFEKFGVPTFLVSSTQYFERELQLFGHKRVIIAASLVGASIGAMITLLVATLRHP